MSTPIIFTVGTPMGEWAGWARAWLGASPAGRRLCQPAFGDWHARVVGAEPASTEIPLVSGTDGLDALHPAPDVGPGPWGGVDVRGCWTLDPLAQKFPDARFLVFIERPGPGLAAALDAGRAEDPAAWLAIWRAGAKRLLRHVQRDPVRCLLVEAEEARRDPAALTAACAARFGLELGPADTWDAPAGDALSLAFAEMLVSTDRDAQSLLAELLGSCLPLTADEPGPTLLGAYPRIDAPSAARRLHELHAAVETIPALTEQLQTLQDRLHAQASEIRNDQEVFAAALAERDMAGGRAEVRAVNAQQLLAEMQHRLATAERQAAESRDEGGLLFQQLHDLYGELELAQAEARACRQQAEQRAEATTASALQLLAETQDRMANAERQAADCGAEVGLLMQQLQDLNGDLELAQAEARACRQQADQRAQDAANADMALDSLGSEKEQLLMQLQLVQDELQHYCTQYLELERSMTAGVPALGGLRLTVGAVSLGAERLDAPHRQLLVTVQQIQIGSRTLSDAVLRLVEHHGHPGLVVFANGSGPQVLSAWQESGSEDGRPYALLVPTDAHCRALFEAMGSTDWLLVRGLVSHLERRLAQAAQPTAIFWRHVAGRLRAQLLEMPLRFRCDTVKVEPAPADGAQGLALRFGRVVCGGRELEQMALVWYPTGPQGRIVLLRDPVTGPPLASWPDPSPGENPDRLTLPVGAPSGRKSMRAVWDRLVPADRDFVAAMLEAWPDLLSMRTGDSQTGPFDATAIRDAALRVRQWGLDMKASGNVLPTGLAGRVVRRLRRRGAAAA